MARDPEKRILVDSNMDIRDIEIPCVSNFDIQDFDPTNEKEYMKNLFRIERICRNSFEYKQFIRFLKENAGMDKCSFLENVSNSESRKIRIEIHHEPITLFDIVSTIFNKRFSLGESIHETMVAKEVLYNHYILHVGLIPLSQTIHELVHNQYLFIPTFAVLGRWREFIKEYDKWVPLDVKSKMDKIEAMSRDYDIEKNTEILKTAMIYINVNDDDYTASAKELYEFINDELDNFKDKNK